MGGILHKILESEIIKELKSAALAAKAQDINTSQKVESGGYIECPQCGGDGEVSIGNDYCNYDDEALGVMFYGIGDAHIKAEAYFKAVKPSVIIDLLTALEEKDQHIAELEQRLQQPIEFPRQHDYDDPLSAYKAINDCRQAIEKAGFKIKE